MIVGLGLFAAFIPGKRETKEESLVEDKPELTKAIIIRALKVYMFVLAPGLPGRRLHADGGHST